MTNDHDDRIRPIDSFDLRFSTTLERVETHKSNNGMCLIYDTCIYFFKWVNRLRVFFSYLSKILIKRLL